MLSCCFPYCYKKPTVICYCKEDGILVCKSHLYEHIVSESSNAHKNEPLWFKLTDENKASLIAEINARIKELIEHKAKLIKTFRQEIEEIVKKLSKNIEHVENGINNYVKCIGQIWKIIEVPRKNDTIIEKALIFPADKGISVLEYDILNNSPELKQLLRPIELPSASKQILDYLKKIDSPIGYSEPNLDYLRKTDYPPVSYTEPKKALKIRKKRPKSAFHLYFADWKREQGRNCGQGVFKEVAEDWKKLTDIEKMPYILQSKELWQKYYKEQYAIAGVASDEVENDENYEDVILNETLNNHK